LSIAGTTSARPTAGGHGAAACAALLWAAAVLSAGLTGGCGKVERTITLTSEPSNARVYVNGKEMGRTPVTFDFLWYGDYRFELSVDGCETLRTHRHVRAKPHQWVPFDLVTEVFIPATFRDDKFFHFALTPMAKVDEDELVKRAETLRDRTIHAQD